MNAPDNSTLWGVKCLILRVCQDKRLIIIYFYNRIKIFRQENHKFGHGIIWISQYDCLIVYLDNKPTVPKYINDQFINFYNPSKNSDQLT